MYVYILIRQVLINLEQACPSNHVAVVEANVAFEITNQIHVSTDAGSGVIATDC